MDDIILLSETKAQLWEWKAAIEEFIARLRLRLHPRKQVVAPARCGIDFLGYVIYPDHVRVRNRNIHRVYDRMKRIEAGTYPRTRGARSCSPGWATLSTPTRTASNQSIQQHPFSSLRDREVLREVLSMPPREHDLHNALFALDDVTERLDAVLFASLH